MVHPGPPPAARPKRQSESSLQESSGRPPIDQTPPSVCSSEPLSNAVSAPTEDSPHHAAAQHAVNTIVSAAASNAALKEERARVQGLISDLVSRVASGNDNTKQPTQSTSTSAATESKNVSNVAKKGGHMSRQAIATGVPLNDHQTYVVRGGPLSWSQNSDSVTVVISVPAWVRKEHVIVRFLPGALDVRVGFAATGEAHFEVTQPLFAAIDVDGSLWMLEGAGKLRKLTLEMEKGRVRWWPRLFMADDPADYTLVTADDPGSPLSADNDSPRPPPPPPPTESACVTESQTESAPTPPPPDVPPPALENVEAMNEKKNTLEDTVKDLVEELVDTVVADAAETPRRAGVFSSPEGVQRPAQPKVLTAADIVRMAEQYRATVSTGGAGAAHAALQLGMFHHHGIGTIAQSDALAAKYYRFALENGALDADAAFRLGLIYNQGADGVEADAEQAVRWWRVAARLGNAVAMFNLGVMAMNGSGCDMDPVEAVAWFRRAQILNPQLQPPAISKTQLAERMKIAERVRKERAKMNMSAEEKLERRNAGLADLKAVAYATMGVAGITVLAVAVRHWWQNRL